MQMRRAADKLCAERDEQRRARRGKQIRARVNAANIDDVIQPSLRALRRSYATAQELPAAHRTCVA